MIAVIAALDTGCGLKRRYRCTATATYAGALRTGKGYDFEVEAAARGFAVVDLCERYCEDDDADVEAAVVKAKGAGRVEPVERVSVVRNPPVVTVFEACKAKCGAAMATTPIEQKCEYSGI